MSGNGQLLDVQKVSQIYGSTKKRFMAVQNVDLTIMEGEFVALLGPSGCGKSTLLRIITGLQQPSEGHVLYRGQEIHGVNPHATIVFQTFALFPWLSVQENVEVALKARNVPPEERASRAVALLDMVGLDGFESAYPRELSGGMRQKVGFARAMAVEPELLCLDEPFSALDVLSAEALRGELLELWISGKLHTRAILMVTHNIEEAVFLANRIVVMDRGPGRVVATVKVELPHPRIRKSPEFLSLVDRVYATLAGQTLPEEEEHGRAPGETGGMRLLPDIPINALSGLLERLDEIPNNTADIYHLATELKIDSDQLLRVTDAAELLGFVKVQKGDIALTTLGEAFAEASILARKEIFASRLKRIPIFRWLQALLNLAGEQGVEWENIQATLEMEFPPEVASEQLETMVSWGRYAEMFAYDDDTGVIHLESALPQPPAQPVT
jgi:NitT/TauT family transport system ATP-binding protein